ncbi:hypothetical protein ACTA71_000753 [Dictyostelium dimigraforme]
MQEVNFNEDDILNKLKEIQKAGFDQKLNKPPKSGIYFDFLRDFGTLVGGLIGSIPIIGSGAAAIFNVLYNHFAVDPNTGEVIRFVSPEEFENRLNYFRRQMEDYVNEKLDETYVNMANAHHRALQKIMNRYHEYVIAFENNFGVPISSLEENEGYVPVYRKYKTSEDIPKGKEELKQMIRSQYQDVLNKIDECLEFFTGGTGSQKRLLRGNYVITVLWFITLQRDVYALGERWDFPPQLRSQVKDSISVKIDECYTHLYKVSGGGNQFRPDTDYDNKDLLRIYRVFSFLDLNLYNENFHRPTLNRETKVAKIDKKYDNLPLYIVNHGVLDMFKPPYDIDHEDENEGYMVYDFINDGVLWINFAYSMLFSYTVSRPSRSFKKVTMEIRVHNFENTLDFQVIIGLVSKLSRGMEQSTFRSITYYRDGKDKDIGKVYKCSFDFLQPKTSFLVSFQSFIPFMNYLQCVHYRLE